MPDASLLPGSMADERFVELENVLRARFATLDLSRALVYLFGTVEESALPALGWQFGALGDAWEAAPGAAERRELLRRVIKRRRKRGTAWAVKDALDAIGYPAVHLEEGVAIPRNGTARYNSAFRHQSHWALFCLVLPASALDGVDDHVLLCLTLERVVLEWKRRTVQLAGIYFVSDDAPGEDFVTKITAAWLPGDEELTVIVDGEPGRWGFNQGSQSGHLLTM